MWIITDTNHEVVDRSSSSNNLSRGYHLANVTVGDIDALVLKGYHRYEITEKLDIKIFDTYDGIKVTHNLVKRNEIELKGIKYEIIETSLRTDKAEDLGFADIKTELQYELDVLNARKAELEV